MSRETSQSSAPAIQPDADIEVNHIRIINGRYAVFGQRSFDISNPANPVDITGQTADGQPAPSNQTAGYGNRS